MGTTPRQPKIISDGAPTRLVGTRAVVKMGGPGLSGGLAFGFAAVFL